MKIKIGHCSAPFPRRSGKKTVYYYYVYDEHGKRVKRSTGAHSRSGAMAVIQERIRTGTLVSDRIIAEAGKGGSILFGDYAEHFFIRDECPICQDKEMRGKPYTKRVLTDNRSRLVMHIMPFFSKIAVSGINAGDIRKWQIWLHDKGLSNSSINRCRSTLSPILDNAVSDGILPMNPIRAVKAPAVPARSSRGAFTPEEISALFSVGWGSEIARLATMLAVFTGMRISEVRALTADKIVDDGVVISQSAERDGTTKSTKGEYDRICPIPHKLAESLLSLADGRTGFIFTLSGRKPVADTYIRKYLYRAMEEAGIERVDEKTGEKLTFHSTRHFLNTELIGANVSGDLVRAAIGHRSTAMTDRYLHLRLGQMQPIAQVQEAIGRMI